MTHHRLRVGNCLDVLPTLEEGEIDSVVCDPPYHLKRSPSSGFMGKTWDGGDIAFRAETWEVTARAVRPGGYLLAFGGTRTWHRLACAIEDGGWEIVDTLLWLYGSGFPKHKSKLKPAWEPIIMARRPGPVVHPLSIDACRIPFASPTDEREAKGKNRHADFDNGPRKNQVYGADHRPRGAGGNWDAPGRWPANVLVDDEAAALLDEQSGERRSSKRGVRRTKNIMRMGGENRRPSHGQADGTDRPGYNDVGGASRFFYCPKASLAERDAGMGDSPKKPLHWSSGDANPGSFQSAGTEKAARNNHPTVKPLALMRWCVRLVTPPGGTVLDQFMGSGSTGCACGLEGFRFVGIDLTAENVEIARRRIIHWRRDELFAADR